MSLSGLHERSNSYISDGHNGSVFVNKLLRIVLQFSYKDVCPELSEIRAILRPTFCDGGSAEGTQSVGFSAAGNSTAFTAQSSVRDGYRRA